MPSNCARPADTDARPISKSPMVSSAPDAWRVAEIWPLVSIALMQADVLAARVTARAKERARFMRPGVDASPRGCQSLREDRARNVVVPHRPAGGLHEADTQRPDVDFRGR